MRRLSWSLIVVVLNAVVVLGAAESYSVVEQADFHKKADELKLDRDAYWRVLLHVVHGRSLVDAPQFFLAPNGKHDPRAELHADLDAFFAASAASAAADAQGTTATTEKFLDPVERFPARCAWLCERLGIDRSRLPISAPKEFDQAVAEFGPRGVSLVFPSAYMSTPASMFGHTLLTIHSSYKNPLLSQGVNYAALTSHDNGIIQAFKGLMGLYPGYYSLLPYYQLVGEYSDLDQRDIWEYALNLNEAETRLLMLHIWELRNVWSGYFFFDENCSYNLLFLLDAARPGLDLHGKTNSFWVIPLDTVRLARDAGLITSSTFRPSRATRVRALAGTLSSEDQEAAYAIALGERACDSISTRDPQKQARIIDTASEFLQSLRGRGKVSVEAYQVRYHALLIARSQLQAPQLADRDIAAPLSPERGHESARVTLGGGRAFDTNFAEFGIRPAYHDLSDPQEGYQSGTQVEFGNVVARWWHDDQRLSLERLDVIRLRSFTARDHFYRPISYAVDTGVTREYFAMDDAHRYQAYLSGGAGACWSPYAGALIDVLFEADLRVGGIDERYSVGAGPSAGVSLPVASDWLLRSEARILRQGLGIQATNWETTISIRWAAWRNLAFMAEGARRARWDVLDTSGVVKALYYF